MLPFAKTRLAALAACAFLALPAWSAEDTVLKGELAVSAGWSRATAPGARVGAGYLTITNSGAAADRLLGASSPRAESVEIHVMSTQGGMMQMDALPDGLEVPAHGSLALAPNGYHLMLVDLPTPLAEGETIPLTLRFESAGTVETTLSVGSLGARGPAGAGAADTAPQGHDAHGGHQGHGAH
ncbi:copper chaperone PCu(A)C [Aureimonas frigidaquae]|uniref:copper chaperone PCu(A)C n=1 Tax=Aureimonas frigidaquae TaxID=424757 RepID=UPI0007813AC8|nr:copper chaperone PCu(A)C [Aureimonas frigidaquae]